MVVTCDAIHAHGVTSPTAVHECPLAVWPDPNRDRLHPPTAGRPSIPRSLVEVHTPQALRAVVPVRGTGCPHGHLDPAPLTLEASATSSGPLVSFPSHKLRRRAPGHTPRVEARQRAPRDSAAAQVSLPLSSYAGSREGHIRHLNLGHKHGSSLSWKRAGSITRFSAPRKLQGLLPNKPLKLPAESGAATDPRSRSGFPGVSRPW